MAIEFELEKLKYYAKRIDGWSSALYKPREHAMRILLNNELTKEEELAIKDLAQAIGEASVMLYELSEKINEIVSLFEECGDRER